MPNDNKTATNVNSKIVIDDRDNPEFWDSAIRDARSQLSEIKMRAARLKAAIKVFQEKRESTTKCPTTGSCHLSLLSGAPL